MMNSAPILGETEVNELIEMESHLRLHRVPRLCLHDHKDRLHAVDARKETLRTPVDMLGGQFGDEVILDQMRACFCPPQLRNGPQCGHSIVEPSLDMPLAPDPLTTESTRLCALGIVAADEIDECDELRQRINTLDERRSTITKQQATPEVFPAFDYAAAMADLAQAQEKLNGQLTIKNTRLRAAIRASLAMAL